MRSFTLVFALLLIGCSQATDKQLSPGLGKATVIQPTHTQTIPKSSATYRVVNNIDSAGIVTLADVDTNSIVSDNDLRKFTVYRKVMRDLIDETAEWKTWTEIADCKHKYIYSGNGTNVWESGQPDTEAMKLVDFVCSY